MATPKAAIETMDVGSSPIERYQNVLGAEAWSEFSDAFSLLAERLRGRVVWNVNSTPRGGGVAELLASLIPYSRGAGIDERWVVIEGSREFFDFTKKAHTLLHGVAPDGSDVTREERRVYEETMQRNTGPLLEMIRPGDVVVLHDPQTAGLVAALAAHGCQVIWRSHIGVDQPNEMVRNAWRWLRPYLVDAAAYVFSRRAYVWDELESAKVHVIAPCIDPFTTKNEDLDHASVNAILRASRILPGPDGEATFLRQDGAAGRVRRAAILSTTVPADARLVLQVSRWDRLKDPAGVLQGFAEHVAPRSDAWLVLAGPSVHAVDDDPEQPGILAHLEAIRSALDPPIRQRIVIAQLPMEDIDENAAIVNALQRRAYVVVQKSLAEGFGLTVAEAMWKAKPVVASRVGGIEDQIEDGRSGILIADPRDLRSFGDAVLGVLADEAKARSLGQGARLRVLRQFLAPRYLKEQTELVSSLVA